MQTQSDGSLDSIRDHIWSLHVPLSIRLASSESRLYDQSDTYLASASRLSYLPRLLQKLLAFFYDDLIIGAENLTAENGYFTYGGVVLKWQMPIGLLYDIHILSTQNLDHEHGRVESGAGSNAALPFDLIVHFSPPTSTTSTTGNLSGSSIPPSAKIVHDTWINSVKEADFLRSGTAKPIMSLGAADSKALYESAWQLDSTIFSRIYQALLPQPPTIWRNIPMRIYLPAAGTETESDVSSKDDTTKITNSKIQGQIKVIQALVSAKVSATTSTTGRPGTMPQTLGAALHDLMPVLFPSKRTPILAKPLLHGIVVPMSAVLEDLARYAAYTDGWLNVVISISG